MIVKAYTWTGRTNWTPFINIAFPAAFLRWIVEQRLPFGLPLFRIYCGPDAFRDCVTPRWQVSFWLRPGKEIEEGDIIWRFNWSWSAPGRVITYEMREAGIL